MSETEWICGVQLGGVKLPAEFPAARNSKSMVHAGTGRWRQKNGRPMLIVGSRLAVYRMDVVTSCVESISVVDTLDVRPATWTFPLTAHAPRKSSIMRYNCHFIFVTVHFRSTGRNQW